MKMGMVGLFGGWGLGLEIAVWRRAYSARKV